VTRVLVLYTLPPDAAAVATGRDAGEFDVSAAAASVAAVLPDAVVAGVRGDPREMLALLDRHAPDVVYNLCEAPFGRPDLEAHAAALFEWAGVRFTGASSDTLALCRQKDLVTLRLAAAAIPVPRAGGFPCFVKPADEAGSAWIGPHSICDDAAAVERARRAIPGRALVQEFLPGREFAIAVWGDGEPAHVSIGETLFQPPLRAITYAAKWDVESDDFRNSPLSYKVPLDDALRAHLVAMARSSWQAVRARGSLRIDVRLDRRGQPKVIDLNPNPECSPDVGLHRAVVEAGWTWEQFVHAQVAWAR
jgi:D-alanine-D-alanine ligase